MPRVGKHPLKVTGLVDQIKFAQITFITIVYIPLQEGYWANSLVVLKLFFESLLANTPPPFDVMVFDNGSCKEVQDYLLDLHRCGKIHFLILSTTNLKKLGALDFLLSTAPGEYIAYADSDVYFLPGWLESSINILKVFPEAGKVTALPLVGGDATRSPAYQRASQDSSIEIQTGLLIPDRFFLAHQLSLGEPEDKVSVRSKDRIDVLLKRSGCETFLTGADFQFVIKKEVVNKILPLHIDDLKDYYDPIYSPVLEKKLEAAGFWLLSTPDYLVHHMGNKIPDLDEEVPWITQRIDVTNNYKLNLNKPVIKKKLFSRIIKTRIVRKLLHTLHTGAYKLLYEYSDK